MTHSIGHDGDDVFGGLSDLMVTSQELFKDDTITSKLTSPSIEETSVLRSTLSIQELTPKPKSDL